jgi:hypothetical protein
MSAFFAFPKLVRRRLAEAGVPSSALFFPCLAVPPSLLWLSATPLDLDWRTAAMAASKWSLLAAFVVYCAVRMRLKAVAGIVGAWTIIVFSFAAVSLASALPFFMAPRLWDGAFLAWDRALGVDHAAFFVWLAGVPGAVAVLDALYFKTPHLTMAAPLVLVALGRYERLHEFLWLFAWTLGIVVTVAAFVPARGLFGSLALAPEVRALLPDAAGDFHLALVDHLISGRLKVYDIAANPGVTVFPSFHFCMAALVAWAFRDIRFLNVVAAAIAVLIVVSIIPIGGHYVVDGIASLPLLAGAIAFNRWTRRARPAGPLNAAGPQPGAAALAFSPGGTSARRSGR